MGEIQFQVLDEEAKRYASQPERFTFVFVEVQLETEQGMQLIVSDGDGSCTCGFFYVHGFCSHTMATELLLQAVRGAKYADTNTTVNSSVNLPAFHTTRS